MNGFDEDEEALTQAIIPDLDFLRKALGSTYVPVQRRTQRLQPKRRLPRKRAANTAPLDSCDSDELSETNSEDDDVTRANPGLAHKRSIDISDSDSDFAKPADDRNPASRGASSGSVIGSSSSSSSGSSGDDSGGPEVGARQADKPGGNQRATRRVKFASRDIHLEEDSWRPAADVGDTQEADTHGDEHGGDDAAGGATPEACDQEVLSHDDEGPAESLEPLPEEDAAPEAGSRLEALHAALHRNRELQHHLAGVLSHLSRLENACMGHEAAVVELQAAAKREHEAELDARRRSGSKSRRGAGSDSALPLSRYWVIDGERPEPPQDAVRLLPLLQALPTTYERQKWGRRATRRLLEGVETAVKAHLTLEALSRLRQQVAGGEPCRVEVDMRREFDQIQAVELTSATAQRVVMELSAKDWNRVAAAHVKDRSPADCRSHYLHYVRPPIEWTEDLNEALQKLAERHEGHEWELVAQELGTGHTAVQAFQQYLKVYRPRAAVPKSAALGGWTDADDAQLRVLAEKFNKNWTRVAEEMGQKYDRHQCRDRYHGQAGKVDRVKGKWQPEEVERLSQALQQFPDTNVYGVWTKVAKLVNTRTPQQCRERYSFMVKDASKAGTSAARPAKKKRNKKEAQGGRDTSSSASD